MGGPHHTELVYFGVDVDSVMCSQAAQGVDKYELGLRFRVPLRGTSGYMILVFHIVFLNPKP